MIVFLAAALKPTASTNGSLKAANITGCFWKMIVFLEAAGNTSRL